MKASPSSSTSPSSSPPQTDGYHVWEAPYGTGRTVRVLCIGAGASGLNLAHQLVQDFGAVPGRSDEQSSGSRRVELTIYDKNPEVAGTWYENK